MPLLLSGLPYDHDSFVLANDLINQLRRYFDFGG
jgi:hypothetical protein